MNHWLKFLLLSALLGFAKSHHFIRLVILAGMGLAGLWMVHTLAQDFNIIQTNNNNNNNNDGDRGLFKRSISEKNRIIDWELVLSRDPVSCVRSFLCQLSAAKKLLTTDEKQILSFVRHSSQEDSSQEDSWASKQLQEALKTGEKLTGPIQCMKLYKYCPFTSKMMMTLLRMFGRRTLNGFSS